MSGKNHSNHNKRNFYHNSRNTTFIAQRKSNQNSHILLSISILVSGREETTEKCIASLDHLRSTVPCELILTDTGCPVEMRELLQQKADKVLKFKWCNDFAAARNVGLQAAKGQWFMFMDDDEWFENTDQIEEFFLSGEYRRYQAASYIVRNYANLEGTEWRDTSLIRMTRMRPDTRFLYPIHETLWPLLDVPKVLEDYVHHYGYADPDPEVQMAKRRRNLDLLLPAIENDPHCMKHYLQGVAEYQAMNDYESGYKIADAGIANCIPGREDNERYVDGLYASAVRMRLRAKRSLEVVRLGREYLEHTPLSDLAKASIFGDLAVAYGELGEDKSCLQYLWEYLKWNKYFAVNKEIWLQQETVILNSCFENFQYRKIMGWGLAASLSLGDADSVAELLTRGELVSWMDAARHWYVMTTPERRAKWQDDFRRLIATLGISSEPGRLPQAVQWEEDGRPYSRVRQLYEVLTVAEEDGAAPVGTEEQENGQIASAEKETDRRIGQERSVSEDMAVQKMQTQSGQGDMAVREKQMQSGQGDAAVREKQVQSGQEVTAVQKAQEQSVQEGVAVSEKQDQSAQEDAVAQEMAALALQLKDKVKSLISMGQYEAASTVIEQLKVYFPADAELLELQEKCISHIG